MKSFLHLSNEASAIYDIHDTLKAYYKMAIKHFINNVKNQIIQQNLLNLSGSVNIFTAEYIIDLNEEEQASVAEEDYATFSMCIELNMQISHLEAAQKICLGRIIKQVRVKVMQDCSFNFTLRFPLHSCSGNAISSCFPTICPSIVHDSQ